MEKSIIPEYNENTQILFERFEDGEIVYDVIEKHPDDIAYDKMIAAKRNHENAIREFQVKQVIEQAQAMTDEQAMENQAVYPFWENGLQVKWNEKYQSFNSDGELVLYKVVQPHTTQADWQPKDVPALFVRVGFDGEILDWVQPTGAHDAYSKGDKVKFENAVWQSEADTNVYAPGVVPEQWTKLYDLLST